MRDELLAVKMTLNANCGHCSAKDVLFKVIKTWGMTIVVGCPLCGTTYIVDLRKILGINQVE